MALTNCTECQKEVSDKATVCPHCGSPINNMTAQEASASVKFKNLKTGESSNIGQAGLWTFLFGTFYFMSKGNWLHAVLSLLFALFSAGISWFIYPFFAKKVMRTFYLKKGWVTQGAGLGQQ